MNVYIMGKRIFTSRAAKAVIKFVEGGGGVCVT